MGAGLLITAIAVKGDMHRDLDWDAGTRFVEGLDLGKVRESDFIEYLERQGDEDISDEELHELLSHLIAGLRTSLKEGYRDQAHLYFGDWSILVAGGTSWGGSEDMPTFEAIERLSHIPGILEAIGFSWPEST